MKPSINLASMPHCVHCKTIAVALTLNYRTIASHERAKDGLPVIESLEVKSISYHCANFHYWKEDLGE